MVRFEPVVMYSFEYLHGRHRIWGEFRPAPDSRDELEPMGITLERLRESYPSSILLVSGGRVTSLPSALDVVVESRIGIGEHNGVLMTLQGTLPLLLMETAGAGPVNHVRLAADPSHPCGYLFARVEGGLKELAGLFEKADVLENLTPKVFARAVAYLGFDHDAFFTLETTDASLAREAVQTATLPGEPGTAESAHHR